MWMKDVVRVGLEVVGDGAVHDAMVAELKKLAGMDEEAYKEKFGNEGRIILGARPNVMIVDDAWAEFANSDDSEPYKITSHNAKVKVRNLKKSQNNDWRKAKKGKGFNGYHREF